jgi:DNA helicase-2/ATP-dependent DNA helicase PcrA
MMLNDAQRAAVEAPIDRPLLVLAAAGSGKTQVLTSRLRRLVGELGVPHDQVVAMTFTRKAAAEMRHRADLGGQGVTIGTFHSVGLRILRQHALLVDLSPDFKVVGEHGGGVGAHAKAIAELRNAGSLQGSGSAGLAYERYLEQCRAKDCVALADLVSLALLALRRGARVAWRHVLVDEFQDTNDAQFELVRVLSHGGRHLTVVGDDYQAIHGWRGARVANVLEFTRRLAAHDPVVVRLEMNYRSRPFILAAASNLIRHNSGQCAKQLLPTREDETDGGRVALVRCSGGTREEAERVAQIAAQRRRGTMAVLFRTNAATEPVEHALRAAGVAYTVKGAYRFFGRREIKDALCYVRIVLGCHAPEDVRRAMQTPSRGVGPASIAKLEAMARAAALGEDLLSVIPGALEARVFPEGGKVATGVRRFLDCVQGLRELAREPALVMHAIVDLLLMEEADVERCENLRQLARCVEATYSTSLHALLRDADSDEDDQEPAGPEAPLTLLTMHASKGLEFDHVILTGMASGSFPSTWGTTDLSEERRLCYVGITRARDLLTLTCPGSKLSRFVAEMSVEA